MLRTLFVIISLLSCIELHAKKYHLTHAVDIGLAQAFALKDQLILVKMNQYSDFYYNKYKKYAYPSLRLRYQISYGLNSRLRVGAETGITFRYQEKKAIDNYYTFYSFPIQVNTTYTFLKLTNSKSLAASIHAGYHYKHPKNKMIDGIGGYLLNADLSFQHAPKKVAIKVGYELQQDKEYFLFVPAFFSQTGDPQLFRFNRLVNQVYFGVMVNLN